MKRTTGKILKRAADLSRSVLSWLSWAFWPTWPFLILPFAKQRLPVIRRDPPR